MKATRTTLAAATPAKIADSGVNGRCVVLTALNNVYLGSSSVTSLGAASFGALGANVYVPLTLSGELWAVSAGGGDVSVIQDD